MKIWELGKLDENVYDAVGGKARGLDFLKKNGYAIADGFVVTEMDSLTEEAYGKIAAQFDELGVAAVSVRSSASNEDGGEYSNAGQYETCLNVDKDGLKTAIKRCMQSLENERAAAYSGQFLHEQSAKMNLVVEEMIQSKYAGVMFSTNPVEKTEILIESVDGLGENLVSGNVSAYRYAIPKNGFRFEENGNLSESLLRKIYEEGLAIANRYQGEVDLEWAVDENDNLSWWQLRPITTLDEGNIDEFNTVNPLDGHLITTRNIGEMLPGAVTPLSISTSVLAIDYGIRNMFKELGAIKRITDLPDYFMAFAYNHHLFIDMTALYTMSLGVQMAKPQAMNLSILGEYYDNYPPVVGKKKWIGARLFNSLRMFKYMFSSKKARKKAGQIYDNLTFAPMTTAKTLYDEITNHLDELNQVLCKHYVCSTFSGSMNSTLYIMLSDQFESREAYQAFISGILSDIDGIESADILASLRALARAILEIDKEAAKRTESELLALVLDEKNEKAHTLYNEFLQKHGHRSIKEAEMRSKAWKNDSVSLMKNLRTVLVSGAQEEERKTFDLEEHLQKLKKSKRGAARWAATNARQAVRDRESSKSNIIRVIDKFKDEYVKLAKMLVAEGYLVDEDSIYFLSHEEIGKLLDGEQSLKRRALSRRTAFKEAEEISFEDIFVGVPKPVDVQSLEKSDSLHGIPVCKGKYCGKARIVKSFDDALTIEKGEIMVASFTDIGWSPYYSLIGALITEVGSALSHGAVVAREYCLPTVVNVRNATKLIKNGDYLYIDAHKGSVSIVSEEEYRKWKEQGE